MKNTFNIKQYYKELGHLLYAVAMADNKVERKETEAVREFVSRQLAGEEHSSDSSGMNQAFYTSFEFEEYARQNMSVEAAHDSFMKFLDANITEIDPLLIERSVKAIEKVASAYRDMNKKEKEMIAKIKYEIRTIADLF